MASQAEECKVWPDVSGRFISSHVLLWMSSQLLLVFPFGLLEMLALNVIFSPRVLRKQDSLVCESIIILAFIFLTVQHLTKLVCLATLSENPFAQVS